MQQTNIELIEGQRFGEERALYGRDGVHLVNCSFDGEEDGESALKEAANILAEDCYFNLRYPFWHDTGVEMKNCELTDKCRAALWYSQDIDVEDCRLHGIKALRECKSISIRDTSILSAEFGWSSQDIRMENTAAEGEYFLLRASDVELSNVQFKGKYSFQYVENAVIENSVLDTKDAFWHAKNVTVCNSTVKGEYLAWYSENLTLIDCKIIGTQPLCYCKNLKLVNCEMIDTDLAFERSEVTATLKNHPVSIQEPVWGTITVE